MRYFAGCKQRKSWVNYLTTLVLFFSQIPLSEARWGINAATGWAASGIHPYRVAGIWSFRAINDYSPSRWRVIPIWETSLGYWDGEVDARKGGSDSVVAFTTGPMFRFQYKLESVKSLSSYLELGIGASWLSDTTISGRQLSTHFQFEDKLGLGLRFGAQQQYDIGLRATHYSNGSIKRPNNGVNMVLLNVGYWL